MYRTAKSAPPCPRNPFQYSSWIIYQNCQTNIQFLRASVMVSVMQWPGRHTANQLIAYDADFLRIGPRPINFQLRAVPPWLVGIFSRCCSVTVISRGDISQVKFTRRKSPFDRQTCARRPDKACRDSHSPYKRAVWLAIRFLVGALHDGLHGNNRSGADVKRRFRERWMQRDLVLAQLYFRAWNVPIAQQMNVLCVNLFCDDGRDEKITAEEEFVVLAVEPLRIGIFEKDRLHE